MPYAISQFMCFTSLPTPNNLNPERSHREMPSALLRTPSKLREPTKPTFSGYVGAFVLISFRPTVVVGGNQLPETIKRGGAG